MAVIDELAVLLTAQTKQFTQGMGDAGKAVTIFAQTIAGVGTATEALTFGREQIEKAIGEITNLSRVALKLGTDFESIQKLEFLGKIKGANIEELSLFFNRLEVKTGEAVRGNKEAERSFNRLGLTSEELVNIPLPEQLEKIADAFKDIHSPALRASALQGIFGRGSRELIPILDLGSKGIKDLFGELERLGVVDNRGAQSVVDLSREIAKLNVEFDLTVRKLTVALAPALIQAVDLMRQAGKAAAGFADALAGSLFPPNKVAAKLEKDIKEFDELVKAFAKPFDAQAVKLSPIQDRVDGLIEKLQELDEKSNKINLARNLGGFRAEADRIAESFNKISKAVVQSQEDLRQWFEFQLADQQKLDILNIDIQRHQRALRVPAPEGSPEFNKPRDVVRRELNELFLDLENTERRMRGRKSPTGPIAKEREKLFELAQSAKLPAKEMAVLEKQIIDFDEAVKRSIKHTEEFRSPFEKLKDEIKDLGEEFQKTLISQETFTAGIRKAAEEFLKAMRIFQAVAPGVAGTAEGFSAVEQGLRDFQQQALLAKLIDPARLEAFLPRLPLEAPPPRQRLPQRPELPPAVPGGQDLQRVPQRKELQLFPGIPDPNKPMRLPFRFQSGGGNFLGRPEEKNPDLGKGAEAFKAIQEQIAILRESLVELRGIRQEVASQDFQSLDLTPV